MDPEKETEDTGFEPVQTQSEPSEAPQPATQADDSASLADAESARPTGGTGFEPAQTQSEPSEASQPATHADDSAAPQDSAPEPAISADELLPFEPAAAPRDVENARLKAVLEAIIYVTDEPLSPEQISAAVEQPRERVLALLDQLSAEYELPDRGLSIREVAGGYKLSTKPEHHDAVRRFVRNLKPPLKLSLPALETLAVIAYKQPITAPEIMEIRGVQGAGVLKTLLDRKLIATAGRKNVVGKPILYKTTREFLVQFGLKDLSELPTLKEFQEIGRLDTETAPVAAASGGEPAPPETPTEEPQRDEPNPPEPARDDPPAESDQSSSEQVN